VWPLWALVLSKIKFLIKDIYKLFTEAYTPNPDNVKTLAKNLTDTIVDRLSNPNQTPRLRPSNIGHPCERQLWYSINTPDDAEEIPPTVKFKFLYGDIIEALVLFLAAEAGHKVEGCQDEVEIAGVKGRRDAVIDGVLVDVKSANSRSFDKFEKHTLAPGNDPFGYLKQLSFYQTASGADQAAFLAVDKELGHLALDFHDGHDEKWPEVIEEKRDLLARESPPDRSFEDIPEGKSGNRRLTVPCTYCPFKKKCWPNLRTYIYSNGPVFLTHVERAPKVTEIPAPTATA
jgi:hypothetical protein